MAKVDSFSFGSITVDGKRYRRDLVLFPDGRIKQRKGGFWIFGSHSLARGEIEELSKAGAREIVVGIGTNAQAGLSSDAISYAEQAHLELHALPSHQAVSEFNRLAGLGKRVGGIIHITC